MSEPPMTAWEEGWIAFRHGSGQHTCPYRFDETHLRSAWLLGWYDAEKAEKDFPTGRPR